MKSITKVEQNPPRIFSNSYWSIPFVLVCGILLRLLVATVGHNYDFDSFLIVARIVNVGGNVYAETLCYNYGPVWFHLSYGLFLMAGRDETLYRLLLVTFLSLVDVGIFFLLLQRYSQRAAIFFLLNPISILITGYHNQFDNLAILLLPFVLLERNTYYAILITLLCLGIIWLTWRESLIVLFRKAVSEIKIQLS